jgi:GcrA cell cycle regulator
MPVSDAAGFCLEAVMANAGLTWTEERIERLKELWGEGLSASQIAAELGGDVSRNSVLGKAHRLGLAQGERKGASTPRPRKPTRPLEPAPVVETSPENNPDSAQMILTQPTAEAAETPLQRDVVVPRAEGVTIMELREAMCRFPLGDPTTPEFRYCGAQAITDRPYCAHHAQIAYQPATERKRLRA